MICISTSPCFHPYLTSNHPLPHMLPLTTKNEETKGKPALNNGAAKPLFFFSIQGTVKFPRSISSCGSFTLPHTPAPGLFCLISVFFGCPA